jgi:hypothetical protein
MGQVGARGRSGARSPRPCTVDRSESALSLPLPPERQQAAELDDRLRVVVDAQVADAIDAFARTLRCAELLDDDRSRLLATAIAARSLTGLQCRQHPLGQRRVALEERAPHGRKHVGVGEHVSLYRESGFNEMACPLDAAGSCVCSRASISRNRSKLTAIGIVVGGKRLIERRRRISLRGERRERALTVARDDPHRLRRDRADAGTHPGRHGADREVLRLNGTANLAGPRVGGDDRERSGEEGHETTLSLQQPATVQGRSGFISRATSRMIVVRNDGRSLMLRRGTPTREVGHHGQTELSRGGLIWFR